MLYKNNYKEGKQCWYDKNGKIIKEEEFIHDVSVDVMKKLKQKGLPKQDVRLKGINFSPNRPID